MNESAPVRQGLEGGRDEGICGVAAVLEDARALPGLDAGKHAA